MKKIFALILAGLLAISMVSCGNEEKKDDEKEETVETDQNYIEEANKNGKFEYALNDEGDYEITKYEPYSVTLSDITLPNEVNGRDIVGVAKDAFKAENSIKSVTMPDTYTYIDEYAFYDCDSLASIKLSANLEEFGIGAFESCDLLTGVNLPAKVTALSEFVFKDCESMKSLDLSNVTAIRKGALLGCSALESVTVSDKIQYATKEAFVGCDKLAYNEENGLCYLGNEANKTILLVAPKSLNLTSCEISATTKVVSDMAFINCSYLNTVVLPDSVVAINGTAFTNCEALEYTATENGLYLGNATNPHVALIGVDIKSIEDFKLQNTVKIICDTAFESCPALEDISFDGTSEQWNAIIKSENWNHDLTVNITCTDKIVTVLG